MSMKLDKRGAALVILVLLTLFCTVCTVSGDDTGDPGVSNESIEKYQYIYPEEKGSIRAENTSVIRSILLSLIQSEHPTFAAQDNTSGIAPDLFQTPEWSPNETPERDPNATERDRGFGQIPALETASAYIIFLFTFGLSALLLFAFSRVGANLSAGYSMHCRRAASLGLAAGYLILSIVTGFISIPLLSMFSASLIAGNQIFLVGIAAFSVVYLLLSSLLLSYAAFTRRSFVLVMTAHPIPAISLVLILWTITEPLAGVTGGPIVVSMIMAVSALFPIVHRIYTKKETGPAPASSGSSSAPTMFSGGGTAPVRTGNGFPPELDDRYMDAELVGRGGMALVFRARRREDGAVVAVKVPTRYDEMTGHCFMKEMQIWKGLSHKNIVEVYAYNILPVPYVEMEYVGLSLAEMKKPLPPDEAVRIVRGVAEGLVYAHAAGLIHRDIKPGNILIAPDGTPRITDWGLGKEVADRQETRFVAFSLDYAAPEQISPGTYGRVDTRTDIFQLGAVFYELLTGKLPFAGEGVGEVSVAILTAEPVPPSGVIGTLSAFDAIVLKCLEKNPEQRYQSIKDLLLDLDAVPGGSS